jgi:hypothetical protein
MQLLKEHWPSDGRSRALAWRRPADRAISVPDSVTTRPHTLIGMTAITIIAAALLAVPGQTVSARYLNDLMMFFDGAHRIVSGQIPHVDFHTPMGPLTNLLPALGLALTGSYGAAMPFGVAFLMLLLAAPMAYVLSSRLRLAIALPLALYLTLILAAPANLGESPTALSFAMFYNRICWVALSLLLCMVVPPRRTSRSLVDGLCAGLFLLLMLYMKASYGVVALALATALLISDAHRPWAALALSVTVAATLVLEAVWHLPSAYALDVLQAIRATGAVQGGAARILVSLRENAFDYTAFVIVAAIAGFALGDRRWLLLLGFCGATGLVIQNQNFQISGIATLALGAAVVAEAIARQDDSRRRSHRPLLIAAFAMFLVLAGPMIFDRGLALATHVVVASTSPAQRFELPRFDRIVLSDAGTASDAAYTAAYVKTLDEGARLIRDRSPQSASIAVLDFVNPFSAGLGAPAPRGDYSVSQFGRTFDMKHHLPAEVVLGDARVVMEPKWALDPPGLEAFLKLYAAYLAANFEWRGETESWRIYLRRDANAENQVELRPRPLVDDALRLSE